MHHFPHILGAGGELVIPVLVFIFWGISALSKVAKQAGQSKTDAPPLRRIIPPNVVLTRNPSATMRPRGMMPAAPQRITAQQPQATARRPQIAVPRPPVMRPVPPMPQAPRLAAPAPPMQLPPMPAPAPAMVTAQAPVDAVLIEPTEEDLRERLIWLEILGKPLALRDSL